MISTTLGFSEGPTTGTYDGTELGSLEGFNYGTVDGKFDALLMRARLWLIDWLMIGKVEVNELDF